jgi:hypothetical protein
MSIITQISCLGPAKKPAKKTKMVDDEEALQAADTKLAAFLDGSGSSESEYKEDKEPESEEETESEGELEDDEPDTRIKLKKGGKKQKKGIIAQDQISAAVAAISDDSSPLVKRAKGRVGSNQTPK